MSKIFVEFYIANKNHRQGLHPRGLPLPSIKPAAAAESLSPLPTTRPAAAAEPLSPPPQNTCRRRHRIPAAAATEHLPPPH
jgi:hypothetical protein